jgi:hypothetical protein
MAASVVSVVSNLCSEKKLDRDAGLAELHHMLPHLNQTARLQLQTSLIESLNDNGVPWESHLGCLLGIKCILQLTDLESSDEESDFARQVVQIACKKLRDKEENRTLKAAGMLEVDFRNHKNLLILLYILFY